MRQGTQLIINVENEQNDLVLWKDLAERFSTSAGTKIEGIFRER